jgi:hypothetical protein
MARLPNQRTQHPTGDLMLDLSTKSAPERVALYRQLAIKLREAAMDGMDDQFRSDFLELAGRYDARAADIWPLDALPARSKPRTRPC